MVPKVFEPLKFDCIRSFVKASEIFTLGYKMHHREHPEILERLVEDGDIADDFLQVSESQ